MGTESSLSGSQQTLALCEDALDAPMSRLAPSTKDTNSPSQCLERLISLYVQKHATACPLLIFFSTSAWSSLRQR